MEIKVFQTKEQIGAAAGKIIADIVKNDPAAKLGLATGASPVPTYRYLIGQYEAGEISFRGVSAYNLDEYCDLPRDDENSYYTFMRRNLFDHIDIDPANTHIPDGNAVDTDAECRRYDALIDSIGGVDVQILGIGTDGHIGFNEPGDSFAPGTFRIKLHESTIESNSIYFKDGKMPRYALTMGIGTIMSAKKIILIATGAAKAKAVKAMIEGEVSPACQASILQTHPDVTVFLDEAAAELLTSEK